MVAMEILERVGKQFMRGASTVGMIMPSPETFEQFIAAMGEQGRQVTAAPELEGKVVNQGGGRPVRVVNLKERASSGMGNTIDYYLVWVNPAGLTMTSDAYLMSQDQLLPVDFPQAREISVDWDAPGELTTHWFSLAADLREWQKATARERGRRRSRRRDGR